MRDSIKIFMAEDDSDDARQVTRTFKAEGLSENLFIFKNGRDLLDTLESSSDQPSCILLDMDMPKVDGFEVIKQLAKSELSQIPIFVMSSGPTHRNILKKKDIQVAAFINKPVQFSDFKELCIMFKIEI